MSLDEQTQAFLEQSRGRPGPPPGEMPLDQFRAAVEPFRGLGFEREEVAALHELVIPPGVPVRLYVPASEEPPPVVVWAHGGSWVRVTVDLMDHHFRVYANRSRCAIAAVEYHLSPEARFPSAIEEVLATARWLCEHGGEHGVDAARIGVAGESSGGNIAAAAALLDRDRGDVGFAHQALLVPVLDARFASRSWDELGADYLLTRAQLEWAVEQYAPGVDRDDPLISPVRAPDLAGLPPTLVVTGEYDPLRDEGERYAERLTAAGVAAKHLRYPGLIHHAVMVPKLIGVGRRMLEESATAIGQALGAGAPAAA